MPQRRGLLPSLWITKGRQLEAAAAGAELVELDSEPFDEFELDFSDELVDSEP